MSATFPQAPLGVRTELFLGSWTDISTEVYQRDPMTVTRGKPDEASEVNPSECTFTLNNTGNQFSINNPMSPYYGLLTRNTPVRHSVPKALLPAPHNTAYLRMEDDNTSFAKATTAAQIQITGSIDIRIDVDRTDYQGRFLASIWGGSWNFATTNSGQLQLEYTPDGVTNVTQTSSAQTPLPIGRRVLRVTLDTTTGNVTFYTAPAGGIDAGPWTQLGAVQPGSGATSLHASTTVALQVGTFYGSVYDFEIRNGIGGTIVGRPAFNAQAAATTSWTDATGLAWTTSGTATIDNRSYRYHGELSQTPKAADPTATDVYSQATASGILRRLQQAQTPINSPLYRAYVRLTGSTAPVAYWPCEDQGASSQIASGLPGGAPMKVAGSALFASDSTFQSSAPIPGVNGSTWTGGVPSAAATWNANVIRLLLDIPSGGDTNNAIVARISTNGTVARMDIVYTTASSGGLTLNCYNSAGTLLGTVGPISFIVGGGGFGGCNGEPMRLDVNLQLVSGSIQANIGGYVIDAPSAAGTGTSFSGSIGAVTSVQINPGGALVGSGVGHVSVQATYDSIFDVISALLAWSGETAAARVLRLCAEEGIACRIVGHPQLSMPMGPQTIQTVPALLQECETTDRGMLFEPRTCLGIGYRTLFSMYNQAPKASVSYAGAQLGAAFASTTDDLLTLNDVTISNADGSAARQVLLVGTMSVQPPPNGVGRVDTSIQVNALSDDYLASIAQWVLHVSTDSHDRFPAIPFDLARSQTPLTVATLDVGDLAAITNPPTWLQPDEIDQLCAGFTETFGPFATWSIDVNGVPAYPYTVASVAPAISSAATFTGGGYAMHVDTDGTGLNAAVSSTAAALAFATVTGYPAWTTNPADYPFDVNIAGERVTIVGPGTCLGTDPFLAQGVAQYMAQQATIAASPTLGAPYPATGYSTQAILVTPAGAPNTFAQTLSAIGAITTSTQYRIWAWVYSTAGRTYTLAANWENGATFVSSSNATPVVVPAGVWTLITGTVTSPASGVNGAKWIVADQGSPTASQTFGVWGLDAAPTASITAASPQTMTAVRSVNGVVKSQASGAGVTLWYRPAIGQITGA